MDKTTKIIGVSIGSVLCLLSTYTATLLVGEENTTTADVAARPYCEDWPEPAFAFLITGRQHGYIEPCGCTGLDFQKGGLARRQALYESLKGRGWNLLPIDVGNQVRRFGPQAAIKFQTTMTALRDMDYRAVGIGPDDLRIDSGELISEIVEDTPLICCNATIAGLPINATDEGVKIIESGRYRIGITAVIGKKEQQAIRGGEIAFSDPAEAIKKAHAAFVKAECNLMVLLCHASTEETEALAVSSEEAKNFNVIITAGGADEPALRPRNIKDTRSYLIETGKKGMFVGVLGIYPGTDQPLRYERIPLDKRFKDAPERLQALANYQKQLETIYKQDWKKLILKPIEHPSGNTFVGSEACKECHEYAYDIWKDSPHYEATHSITFPGERSTIPRNFDPECLSCHVTGWHPQNYFPYVSGYQDYDVSKHLHGNGCENCHGPGSAHVAAERGEGDPNEAMLEKLREAMQLPLEKARDQCLQCHDLDNDPHFQEDGAFDEYWAEIEHNE